MTTDDRMAVELIEEAEPAPEPGNFNRRQVIHSPSDAFPLDMQIASLESAGYVYVYDTLNGERSVVNRNMLESQLQKLREDGTRYFTTVKPDVEPMRGTLKCLLHPDDPERGQYDIWGFPTCNKSNLVSEFQVNRHVQIRHRMEWQTIYEERERKEKEEERDFQRQLLGLATQGRPQAQGPIVDNIGISSTVTYTPCECGGQVREGYVAQHTRSKKHQRWEKKNGSQYS
tara:strand:+ start:2863 stop:3549 length:687 start_codon:yes stop_codon:yes gene_type:complete